MEHYESPKRWHALWTVYLLFFNCALLVFYIPPLRPWLPHGLASPAHDVQFGWLQGIFSAPAVIFALALGFLLDRWESRRAGITAGVLLLGGNLLFNLGFDYWTMFTGRFLTGLGALLFNLVAARMLSIWFQAKQKGLAMSVLHNGWPFAVILAYSVLPAAGRALGWQLTTMIINASVISAVLFFILLAPKDPEIKDKAAPDRRLRHLLSMPRDLWLAAVCFFCFAASMISIMSFGPEFFREQGWSIEEGTFVVGMVAWPAILGALTAGWLMDRFAALKFYIIIPALAISMCIVGMLSPIHPMIIMLVLGFLVNFIPVAVYSLSGVVASPARLGIAFGIVLTVMNLGNVFGSVSAGWLNTRFGTRAAGMIMSASIFVVCAACAWFLGKWKLVKQDR